MESTIEKAVAEYTDSDIGEDLTPDHVDVGATQRTLVPSRLFDGFPNSQEAEAESEAGSHRGDLDVGLRSHDVRTE